MIENSDFNAQTAKIGWRDLEQFFAAGKVLHVAAGQDLVSIATWLANDEAEKIALLIDAELIAFVNDEQAAQWVRNDAELWAVVVSPLVVVQDIE